MRRSWSGGRATAAVAILGAGLAAAAVTAPTASSATALRHRATGADGVGGGAVQSLRVGPIGATGPVSAQYGSAVASQSGRSRRATGPLTRLASIGAARSGRVALVRSCSAGPTPTTTTTTTTTSTTSTTTTLAPTTTTTTTLAPTTTSTTSTTTTTLAPTTTSTTTTAPRSTTTSTNLLGGIRRPAVRARARATTPTTTTIPSATTSSTVPSTSQTPVPTTTSPVVATPSFASGAYYLVENNGGVHPYGGAGFFGSKAAKRLPSPVIGGSPTADGEGYWMASAKGSVYNFGDAHFYGSAVHVRHLTPIVAIVATPDGQGYWLVSRSGAVYNFGDAQFCGSAVHLPLRSPIVGFAATPDGGGYWMVTAKGAVYNFGDATFYGSAVHVRDRYPIVGMGASVDGAGYWLARANGSIYDYGDARFYGSPVHVAHLQPIVSVTPTPDGGGYWVATSTGRVYNYGDAHFSGSLARTQPRKPLAVVALIRTSLAGASTTTSPLPHGTFGYDISNYQCARGKPSSIQADVPSTSAFAVLQVTGWLDSSDNTCLKSEVAWATQAAGTSHAPYSLYLFMNSPGQTAPARAQEATGPAGACGTLSPLAASTCDAYNYGYNGAKAALAYADAQGAPSAVWWLDIENDHLSSSNYSNFPSSYWSDSTALNDQTIQGALDALHQAGVTTGIYSTSVQYPHIAGAFVPSGPRVALWVAGVPWTSPPFTEKGLDSPAVLARWCAGTATYSGTKTLDTFAGGVPWLLQETPGNEPSPYGLDPDYAC